MRKLSSAIVVPSSMLVGLVGCFIVAQGCSSSAKTPGFFPDETATDKSDAAVGTVSDASVTGPSFSNDAGEGGSSLIGDGAACATATAQTHRDPVYLLFVEDGSGSMASDNKWAAETAALDAIFDDMLVQQDKDLGVGLIVFSDMLDPTGGLGPYPSSKDVFIGYVDQTQHDMLRARIDLSKPDNLTPTQIALSGGYKLLENLVVLPPLPSNGRKVLVLLTDGVPNGGGSEQAACVGLAATELTKTGPQGPITTFAIGVGPFPTTSAGDYDPGFMGQLAKAGGAAPAGCNPGEQSDLTKVCHFQVTPNGLPVAQIKQQFVDAINKIRGQVSSCDFTLEQPDGGAAEDPTKINVLYTDGNGVQHIIPQDPNSGWTYDDPNMPTKVVLNGSSCTEVKSDPHSKVTILLGCKTQTN